MRKYITIISFLLFCVSVTNAQNIEEFLLKEKINRNALVYKLNSPKVNYQIQTVMNDNIVTIVDQNTVYFIDEDPMANWGHSCRYVVMDKRNRPSQIRE